jgi:hypothetical protein
MLYPILQPNGKTLITLICDRCRKPIRQAEYSAATVDFTPLTMERLESMPADHQLSPVLHFHGECAPRRCMGSHWQKADHVLLAMVGGLFDEPGDWIGAAVADKRSNLRPDVQFP